MDADVLDAIEAVDWSVVPGRRQPDLRELGVECGPSRQLPYTVWYSPERVADGLRDLAGATSNLQAALAASRLRGGGILHDHSGAVFPAAVVAAPILLDIAEHGHPKARAACLSLLRESLELYPLADYTRIDTISADGVPLCCAIAEHVRTRRDALSAQGPGAKSLLAEAAQHWRFQVDDVVIEHGDVAVFGVLHGAFPDGRQPAEVHDAHRDIGLTDVVLEIPPEYDSPEACLRLIDVPADRVRAGAVLYPAVCGERVH
ncbi:hypothetical protein OG417_09475 [Actinoallomurus sp. NBC_01490]|uniref:hypothetical protein n=1 Tax=Actinoallomurus sp. NBC_01490 TaxID=2903557 RepID=UPI002E2EA64A|nr:hypothetical protein [Actinoallomurus sp. NBC_01490]